LSRSSVASNRLKSASQAERDLLAVEVDAMLDDDMAVEDEEA
jgi:hypothetical protein